MRRLEMLKAREIVRLKYEKGLTTREIGESVGCGKSAVSEIIKRSKRDGLAWPIDLSDMQLMSLLYPSDKKTSDKAPEPDMDYVFKELKRKGVTLTLLWEEYKEKHSSGLMYTQFCNRYKEFKKINKITMHKEHKAGEEVEVDWAGSTMSYIDRLTGELVTAYIFVAVLPASSYPFIRAYEDMRIESWIDGHVRTYEYFGGVPQVTIPDNTKTAVIQTHRYSPTLNKSYHEMATHYGTTIIPARSRKPKDKGSVENTVGNITRRVIAALRDRQFFSLGDMNEAITLELEKFTLKPFQKMEESRLTLFEKVDKPCLMSLPRTKYEYSEWKEAKVAFNYHVEYEGFFYSVHFTYVSKLCSIRATSKTIEIYVGTERVATHCRNHNTLERYTTLPEHMSDNHKAVSKWNSERLLAWAEKTGPNTREFIKTLLENRKYPVQAYRACMAVLSLTKTYSNEVMEKASTEALTKNLYASKYFSLIVSQVAREEPKKQVEKIIENSNLRGKSSFALTGGINVK